MASSDVHRKLTAILCADVVGYSRLMGENEQATLRLLTDYRQVFSEYIAKFRGRVVNAPGDSILAEFGSVVDAVEGASEIQRELAERNAELLEERRMQFRIGINLGDVLVKEDAIYGDGVNIAARLESLAEPGGICISRPVYDQVKQKLKHHYEYMGEQKVKNIAEPVRAYQVLTKPGDAAHRVVQAKQSAGHSEYPEIPEQPSIAVLPFTNMSSDPEQEYFGDGLAEDIITDLSKLSGLFVIARNSSFSFKGQQMTVQQIGLELGVRHVLEGSVRKSADRVRINVQLVEAKTGHHLWAERYDRKFENIFTVQDEITNEVITALDVKLLRGETARLFRKSLKRPESLEMAYRGFALARQISRRDKEQARVCFEKVIELEPESPAGYIGVAFTYFTESFWKWSSDIEQSLNQSKYYVQKALDLDKENVLALIARALIHIQEGEYDKAIAKGEQAISIAPNFEFIHIGMAQILTFSGKHKDAISFAENGARMNPIPFSWNLHTLGYCLAHVGRIEEAIEVELKAIEKSTDSVDYHLVLAICYAQLGQWEEAKDELRTIRRIDSSLSIEDFVKSLPYKEPSVAEAMIAIIRKIEAASLHQ